MKPDCVFQDGSYPCDGANKPDCELCEKIYNAGDAITFLEGVQEGIQKGRKEVVEWVEDNCVGDYRVVGWVRLEPEDWEAKLKEWGLTLTEK